MSTIQEVIQSLSGYSSLSATYDVRDDYLRLYSLTRYSTEDFKLLSKLDGFRWAPKQACFYALWSPAREDFLMAICGDITDEDQTPLKRAKLRAERFEQYSQNREHDSETAFAGAKAISSHIPLGQPIMIGHHSEKRHRRDVNKIDNHMRRSVNMWKAAEYWKMRAEASLAHAEHKERPDVRYRRIKKFKTQIRQCERAIQPRQANVALWESETELTLENAMRIAEQAPLYMCYSLAKYPRPANKSQSEEKMSLYCALENEILMPQMAKDMSLKAYAKTITHYQRWIEHYQNRIVYEETMMREQVGELIDDKWQCMQVGGKIAVSISYRYEWLTILKLNRRNGKIVSVWARDPSMTGHGADWKYTLEKITNYQPPETDDKPAKVITCNYPGEGIREITTQEWNKTPRDYKSLNIITQDGVTYKVRRKMFYLCSAQVFLTDKKVVLPPKP